MSIQTLRQRIDRIDTQLMALLNRRARLAQQIGTLKRRAGSGRVDQQRERAILLRLCRANRGPLQARQLRAIYRQLFKVTRALQQQRQTRRRA